MVTIIVATDKNRAIGIENKIPWRIKSDLVRLSKLTRGHTVILGRKSYDSMVWYYGRSGKRMPGACYIVVTRNPDYEPTTDSARVAHSVPEAMQFAKDIGDPEIMVIGGGSIFAAALPLADCIHLTEVQVTLEGNIDAYFPKIDPAGWREVSREHHEKSETDQYATQVIVLEKT